MRIILLSPSRNVTHFVKRSVLEIFIPVSLPQALHFGEGGPLDANRRQAAPTQGPTRSDHFHPGSYAPCSMVIASIRISSSLPFSEVRTPSDISGGYLILMG